MRQSVFLWVGALLLLGGVAMGQTVPPVNLTAELTSPQGAVTLQWEPPPDGLIEDFEDGEAQGFQWSVPSGNYVLEDGYCKLTTDSDWGSGAYMDVTFEGEYTAEVTFEYQVGNLSRGILFNGNGPRDNDYTGYGFWIAHTLDGYAVWQYTGGNGTAAIYWVNAANLINEGVGAVNTLRIENYAGGVDLYLNDTYVNTLEDPLHTSGHVGIVSASSNQVWYEEVSGLFGITGAAAAEMDRRPVGTPIDGAYNEFGLPAGEMPPMVSSRPAPPVPEVDELDEFIEYMVYRDGQLIGTAETESFTDMLPGLGEYVYTVTALYDEGESSSTNTATVTYEAGLLNVVGVETVVPATGGTVVYGVEFMFNMNMTVPGVTFWTELTLPNGQEFGPLFQYPFTLTPYMQAEVFNLTQMVPALAPAGLYTFYGHVGFLPNPQLSDSFEFEKLGGGPAGAMVFDPADWPVSAKQAVGVDSFRR